MALIGTTNFSHFSHLRLLLLFFSTVFVFIPFLLVGVLAAAIPVAFLNPSLGFRKRRSVEEDEEIFEKLGFAQKGVEEGEEVFNRALRPLKKGTNISQKKTSLMISPVAERQEKLMCRMQI